MISDFVRDLGSSGWYVVYTRPKQESRALENLQNQGFECLLPTLAAERLCFGRRSEVLEPLFPRYLFVWLEAGRSNWAAIRSTRGAVRLVEFGGKAARVSPVLIDALRGQSLPRRELFATGDQIKIVEGPFSGVNAELLRLYEAPDGETRALLLMEILARPQRISMPVSVVRKAA